MGATAAELRGEALEARLPLTQDSEGGGDTVGNPCRAQISRFEFFELILLLKIRQTVPCRAIRGNRISVNSVPFPVLEDAVTQMCAAGASLDWVDVQRLSAELLGYMYIYIYIDTCIYIYI